MSATRRIVTDMRTGQRSLAGPGVAMRQRETQEREDEETRAAMAAAWFEGLGRRRGWFSANEPSWAEVVS